MKQPEPLIIKEFQKGIGDSPHVGFADMRNIDVTSTPGVAKLNFKTQMVTPSPGSFTFTADASTDVVTLTNGSSVDNFRWNGHGATKRAVTVSSTGTLPTGLSPSTVYWVIDVTSTTLKLATTRANAEAGTAIDITGAGSGTHTIASIDMGLVQFFTEDAYGSHVYAQDSNGRIWEGSNGDWYLLSGNTLTNAFAQGLAIWQNYLFAFRSAKVDVYGPLTSAEASRSWTNDWQSLTASAGETYHHYALVGQDDILYFADCNSTTGISYIGSIQHSGTFDPATSSTYTFTLQALDLPAYKYVTCLEELGTNLMIGTTGREIYPWDRSSDTFSLPILAAEDGITAMRTINNVLYFAAGLRGNVYATIGSSTKLVRSVPASITGVPYNSVNIPAMVGHKGKLFFTVECAGCSGVWSLDLVSGALDLAHRITTSPINNTTITGSYGTLNGLKLPAIYSNGAVDFIVSWKDVDNTTYGLNQLIYLSTGRYATGYIGYFDSPLYQVGDHFNPRTFSTITVGLAKPLTTEQGVRISYRKDLSASFTTLATFDYSTYGGVSTFQSDAPITDAVFLQIRCELTVGTNATATPELRTIQLNYAV